MTPAPGIAAPGTLGKPAHSPANAGPNLGKILDSNDCDTGKRVGQAGPVKNNGDDHADQRSVLSVMRDIKQGTIHPRNLAIAVRHRCVEHLTSEGYSTAEIAEILDVAERTIARDRAAIKQGNSIQRDPNMTGQMVGQLLLQAETAVSHIRRVTRERATSASVRIEGEKACWVITRDLVERLQSLGYLPTAATEIRGELLHRSESLPEFSQMMQEVKRIETILGTAVVLDDDQSQDDLQRQLAVVKDQVTRGSLTEKITSITRRLIGKDGDDSNDTSRQADGQ